MNLGLSCPRRSMALQPFIVVQPIDLANGEMESVSEWYQQCVSVVVCSIFGKRLKYNNTSKQVNASK